MKISELRMIDLGEKEIECPHCESMHSIFYILPPKKIEVSLECLYMCPGCLLLVMLEEEQRVQP